MTLFVHVEKCTFNRMYKYFFSETLWEATVFKLEIYNGIVVKYEFRNDFKVKLRNEACHTEFNQ